MEVLPEGGKIRGA